MSNVDILEGITVSSGVGIGCTHLIKTEKVDISTGKFTSAQEEKDRLQAAMDSFCFQTYGMFQKIRNLLGQEEALILGGQIFMARDLEFVGELHQEIDQKITAEQAVTLVFDRYLSYFKDMEDELMSQRGEDLKDMRNTVLEILCGQQRQHCFCQDNPVVLCVEELTPSLMSVLSGEKVVAILCEKGGVTSHCAILARATGIPAIFAVDQMFSHIKEGDTLVVDASCGRIFRNPEETMLEKYRDKAKHFNKKRGELEGFRQEVTKTAQGEAITLLANITDSGQIHTALDLVADGIGLFRTEYLYMEAETLPSESQQCRAYSRMAKMMDKRPVAIRTLDIGGDKMAACIPMDQEDNPFLGERALRLCLKHPAIFTSQIRAILRAAAEYPNITILIPFVVELDEILKVKKIIAKCTQELIEEGHSVPEHVPFGVVIETPSAAMLVDLILDEVDYISIGTNDLTQYFTVADRGNLRVANYYNPFNLSILRTLDKVIKCCNQKKIPVTVCGEVVSDPRMVPLLLGFGSVNFSVSPSEMLALRRELSFWTREEACSVTDFVMNLQQSREIEEYLQEVILDKDARNQLFQEKLEKIALGNEKKT